jgi:CheY-like chemotaxis protein
MTMVTVAPLLLVEDDQNDVMLVERAFEKARVRNPIVPVAGVEEAQLWLSRALDSGAVEALPAMIVLDLKLGGGSGHDLLAWLRERPALTGIPIVVLTGSRASDDLAQAYTLGANAYLVKPVDFDALIDAAQQLAVSWVLVNDGGG